VAVFRTGWEHQRYRATIPARMVELGLLRERWAVQTHSPVWSLRFSPDGKTLAVGGDHGIVRLYRATDPARLLDDARRTHAKAPGEPEATRDLLLALWGQYLDRRRAQDPDGARAALEEAVALEAHLPREGRDADELGRWLEVFRQALVEGRE